MMSADPEQSSGKDAGSQRHPAVSFGGLVVSIVICFSAAAVGAQFAPGAWYAQLNRPSFAPPNAVFGPVWTILYLCMAVAAWRVWNRCDWSTAAPALAAFAVQLILNASWSWLFFGLHRIDAALIEIVALLIAIGVTIRLFCARDRLGGWLMVPYFLWVAFAAVLNFAFWQLN